METFTLADHQELSDQSNLSREEAFQTRLVQIDRPLRTGVRDPLQHSLRKAFRRIWYHMLSGPAISSSPRPSPPSESASQTESRIERGAAKSAERPQRRRWRTRQKTAWFADITSRFLYGLLSCTLLIAPMAVLRSQQSSGSAPLITVSVSVALFSLLVALGSRASPQETMAASAAYAAVLVVFVATNYVGGNACQP